jgi:uncharacterized protein
MDWTLTVDGVEVGLAGLVALGTGVGVVAGMFGVGGGFLLVPLLGALLGVPVPAAVAAGLCQTIATGLGALLRHRSMGHAETRFDLVLIGGSLLGIDAGTRLLRALDGAGTVWLLGREIGLLRLWVTGLYVLLFLVMAAILWLKPSPAADAPVRPGPLARVPLPPRVHLPIARMQVSGPFVGMVGFANGVLAGMLGIGGGIVLIPIMLYGFGFNIRATAGTGNVVVLVIAVIGTIQHAVHGSLHLGLAMTLSVGAALSAQVGANLTRSLPSGQLRRGLAIVLALTIGVLLFRLSRGG